MIAKNNTFYALKVCYEGNLYRNVSFKSLWLHTMMRNFKRCSKKSNVGGNFVRDMNGNKILKYT